MKRWLVVVPFMSMLAIPALAEEPMSGVGGHPQGTWELNLTSDFSEGFSTSVGYYAVDNLSAILLASLSNSTAEAAGFPSLDTTDLVVGVGLEQNVPISQTVTPFVGVQVQYLDSTDDDFDSLTGTVDEMHLTGTFFVVSGGLKFTAGTRSSVNVGLSYSVGTVAAEFNGTPAPDTDLTDFDISLGYSLYFR